MAGLFESQSTGLAHTVMVLAVLGALSCALASAFLITPLSPDLKSKSDHTKQEDLKRAPMVTQVGVVSAIVALAAGAALSGNLKGN